MKHKKISQKFFASRKSADFLGQQKSEIPQNSKNFGSRKSVDFLAFGFHKNTEVFL